MTSRIVVTGFDAFGEHAVNPSERLARRLSEEFPSELAPEILPTAYARAGRRIEALIETARPAGVLMFGLAAGARGLRLERFAHNRDGALSFDNDGERRAAGAIVEDGPDCYRSTLPLQPFAEAVRAADCPLEWSSDAGNFVCNHAFYRARHSTARLNCEIPCGFVHVPARAALDLDPWLRGARACVGVLLAR